MELWRALLDGGADFGIRPHGLKALLCLRVGAGRFLMLAGTVLVLVHLGLTFAEVNGFITTVAVFHAVGLQDVAMLTILLSLVGSLLGLLPSTARWVSTLRT